MQRPASSRRWCCRCARSARSPARSTHMLGKAAEFYEDEVDEVVKGLSSLMEPIIIVILGVLIGGIVVSMYLPIFKLGPGGLSLCAPSSLRSLLAAQKVLDGRRTLRHALDRDLLRPRPGPVRAVRRQLPERRHPPPPADARARLEAGKRRPARRRARGGALADALDAALALPVVRPCDRAGTRTSRSRAGSGCAAAARPARHPISARYPLVELATGALFALVGWRFGAQPGRAALVPVLRARSSPSPGSTGTRRCCPTTSRCRCSGPASSSPPSAGRFRSPTRSGAPSSATSSLWSVYWLFKLTTGKEGMGFGDFKLLAALGAWLGWQMILPIVLGASIIGALVGIVMKMSAALREGRYVPFGPFLAGAGAGRAASPARSASSAGCAGPAQAAPAARAHGRPAHRPDRRHRQRQEHGRRDASRRSAPSSIDTDAHRPPTDAARRRRDAAIARDVRRRLHRRRRRPRPRRACALRPSPTGPRRQRLEAILHPLIGVEVERAAAAAPAAAPALVFDVPLLVESGRWRGAGRLRLARRLRRGGAGRARRRAARLERRSGALGDRAAGVARGTPHAAADAVIDNQAQGLDELARQVQQLWDEVTAGRS